MLHFKRRSEESMDDFMSRTNGTIKRLPILHGRVTWDRLVHREVFKWAGWLSRLYLDSQLRISRVVFRHKDWNWIQQIASQNNGRQLHCRYLRTWRWERP
eukprot:556931-Karenia_brevis.AAC.1